MRSGLGRPWEPNDKSTQASPGVRALWSCSQVCTELDQMWPKRPNIGRSLGAASGSGSAARDEMSRSATASSQKSGGGGPDSCCPQWPCSESVHLGLFSTICGPCFEHRQGTRSRCARVDSRGSRSKPLLRSSQCRCACTTLVPYTALQISLPTCRVLQTCCSTAPSCFEYYVVCCTHRHRADFVEPPWLRAKPATPGPTSVEVALVWPSRAQIRSIFRSTPGRGWSNSGEI